MLNPPEEPTREELERRMRPGSFSQGGFLGPHDHLDSVIEKDSGTVQALGTTHEDIAQRLAALVDAGLQQREGWMAVPPHFRVRVDVFKGYQLCPWVLDLGSGRCGQGGGVRHGSVDWRIHNQRTGQSMGGAGLLIHLIRDHHFFEGPGSPYRADPERLSRLLELS